jgi:DNA/RNA-binding protein KIN17
MNATIFDSLSNFVQYLGRTGKAVVDQTPKGWFCAYINRDPDAVAKQEALQAKEHSQLTDEELAERIIQQQMAMARQTAVPESKQEFQEFIREDPDQKLSFSMKQSAKLSGSGLAVVAPIIQTSLLVPNDVTESVVVASKRKRSALEELMEEEEAKKRFASASEVKGKPHVSATSDHLDNWICKGIVVKIMNKSLAHGEFYKAKGIF